MASSAKKKLNYWQRVLFAGSFLLFAGAIWVGHAQNEAVEFKTTALNDHLFMLQGKGGNLGLSVGEDGAFLIDDDYAGLSGKIKAAIAEQTDQPLRFVINTHWHNDHTGGNEALGKSGAIIVAHENVRKRLSSEQFIKAFDMKVSATADAGLPIITFDQAIGFHLNGDEINISHVPPAHTDGDAMVYFKSSNVLHTGDVYFNGLYPFMDASSGGRMDGMITGCEKALALADGKTKIIPGHGPLSTKAELQAYHDMLVKVRDKVQSLIDDGKTRTQVIAAKPTIEFDKQWGQGFLPPDTWVGIVYDAMQ